MTPAAIPLGDFQLTILSGGTMRLDGGNMFGVIPRMMWQRVTPADEQHRIAMDTNCVLVRTPDSLGLIDTGYGSKAPPKIRMRSDLEDGAPLVANLAAAGYAPSDIDWVLLTHLHFDHVGGCTYRDDQHQLRPTFPRARHLIHRVEWEDASSQAPELANSYFVDDFVPLQQAGLIDFIDSDGEFAAGLATLLTGGHTRGHMIVTLNSKGHSAVCTADLCPTAAHLPTFWSMAYDQFPLEVRRVKPGVLHDIAEHNRLLLLSHDPKIRAARIVNADHQLRIAELVD